MPRYRFSWEHLPPALLSHLGRDLRLSPPIGKALLHRYGARPRADFVRDSWPTLREVWLGNDAYSRERVISQLRRSGAGDTEVPLGSGAGQMEYLRSLSPSRVLGDVVAAAVRALGEPRLVGEPAAGRWRPGDGGRAGAGDVDGPAPVGPDRAAGPPPGGLADWLRGAMAEILGPDDVHLDQDGDIGVRAGSTMCYVRGVDDPPSVRLFAPMVVEVSRTAALLDALNDINMTITAGRVFHTAANEVIFAIELYGEQLTVDIIRQSLAAATIVADHFDHRLQSRFGGKTMFAEVSDDSVML